MREYEHPLDYQHIAKNADIHGWNEEFRRDQQKLAYMLNAPYDTIEIVNGKALRFVDLTREEKLKFMGESNG